MMIREICKRCWRINPLGFSVPDDIWQAAVPEGLRDRVLCILCFDELATGAGVDWTAGPVAFYPVSGVQHRREEAGEWGRESKVHEIRHQPALDEG